MKNFELKDKIAERVALELKDNQVVNLGIGLPTLIANKFKEDSKIYFESENGIICMGPKPEIEDEDVTNAGGGFVTVLPNGMFFDSATSFGMIRGGHIDVCVLGALQVDKYGNLASWIIPDKLVAGMGGAMDLVCGAKKVIIAMIHSANGKPKILNECTLPLTAEKVVDMIITEYGVFEIKKDGMFLVELNGKYSLEDIKAVTEAEFIVSDTLKIV